MTETITNEKRLINTLEDISNNFHRTFNTEEKIAMRKKAEEARGAEIEAGEKWVGSQRYVMDSNGHWMKVSS